MKMTNAGHAAAVRSGCVLVALMLAGAMVAPPLSAEAWPEPGAKEKRFLVRFDHGTANLGPWQEIALYVGDEKIYVYTGNELVHEFAAASLMGVTHELRAPFDPGKVTERVFNDTVGACSDLLTCPVLGAAGVVGAAGVGIATLFTPKQTIVTLHWNEGGEARTLAMKIAWYQRDFILRAVEKASGKKAEERKPGRPPTPAPAASATRASTVAGVPATPAPSGVAPSPMAAPLLIRPQSQAAQPLALGPIERHRVQLDYDVMFCNVLLRRGAYDMLLQDRSTGTVVAFAPIGEAGQPQRIVARALASRESAQPEQQLGIAYATPGSITSISEVRLPGRTLRLPL